jgi:hypothetical protein
LCDNIAAEITVLKTKPNRIETALMAIVQMDAFSIRANIEKVMRGLSGSGTPSPLYVPWAVQGGLNEGR